MDNLAQRKEHVVKKIKTIQEERDCYLRDLQYIQSL
jgi:hypothetical protein